jgi:hypothetical protein
VRPNRRSAAAACWFVWSDGRPPFARKWSVLGRDGEVTEDGRATPDHATLALAHESLAFVRDRPTSGYRMSMDFGRMGGDAGGMGRDGRRSAFVTLGVRRSRLSSLSVHVTIACRPNGARASRHAPLYLCLSRGPCFGARQFLPVVKASLESFIRPRVVIVTRFGRRPNPQDNGSPRFGGALS